MTHLDELEAEAIYIMREVAATCEKPVMLYSIGKDSSVMVQLANCVAKEMNRKFDVLYIDFEAQYRHTIEHIEELKTLSQIR